VSVGAPADRFFSPQPDLSRSFPGGSSVLDDHLGCESGIAKFAVLVEYQARL
jgi:hypothetical protein